MKGISPLIASVLLIAITMTLAAILATFVSNYTRQQLSALPACVGGTLLFVTNDYPKISGTTITAVVEAGSVDLAGFTIEAINSTGTVASANCTTCGTIKAGSSGTVTATPFTGVVVGNKARVIAVNCPTVKTDWTALK